GHREHHASPTRRSSDLLDAGRYLLTIGGEAGPDDFALATIIMQLPEGVTVDDAVAQIGDGSEGLPEFFYEAVFAGGKSALVAAGDRKSTRLNSSHVKHW